MMTKKNYYILAGIVAVLVLAFIGIMNLFGFTEYWGWLRLVLFFIMTYTLLVTPLLFIMKIWGGIQNARDKASQEMKARREQQQ
jgi:type IV secretory pathway VirB2 component (pilin)